MPVQGLVFVDIDTQFDFLDPRGALFVAGSESILENLGRLTEFARREGIPTLASACAHAAGDEELESFPPHCLIGTTGQARVPATARPDGRVLGPDARLEGPPPLHLTLEKRWFDVFSHPDADRLVSIYDEGKPTFVVYGVATDYCVVAAATGLLDRHCRVALVVDAIRAIDPDREADVLGSLVARGATLTLTEVVCDRPEAVAVAAGLHS